MAVGANVPTREQIQEIAEDFGLSLGGATIDAYQSIMTAVFNHYRTIDGLTEPKLEVKYPRTPGYRPEPEENPYNGWYWKTDIKGASKGILKGKTVALKDNICLAGVPMMNGSRVLEGFVPDVDATVVTRILDAGGTIAGKASCEDLCFSGGGHTCALGPVRNPRKPTHSPGASSNGSGVLVANGDVDMALGGDQGGSIRIPAAWCGTYGLKATHGLVPYTGIIPIEMTLDHCGPMTQSMEDLARLLTAIAGVDGLDPRQPATVKPKNYMAALEGDVKGLKIAVLKEGFGQKPRDDIGLPGSDPATDQKVKAALKQLEKRGASLSEISVPMHAQGVALWNAIIIEGSTECMIKGNTLGSNWQGYYNTQAADIYARGWRSRPNDFSDTVKVVALIGEYMNRNYHSRYYHKAQNIRRVLRAKYEAVLASYDLIAFPAVTFRAPPLPAPDCPPGEYFAAALNMIGNTVQFDVSGHPVASIPCGMEDDLPIGLGLCGRFFDEPTIIRAGATFERIGDWTKM
jgi:amidase